MQVEAPKFSLSFFAPKFWPIWIGVSLLYVISWLPYPILRLFGKGIGRLVAVAAKKRVKVAERNFELCFPDWPEEKRQELLKQHLDATGMALFETAMGWWWPKWRVAGIGRIEGFEHVEAILAKGKGVLGLTIHNMSLELGCTIAGLKHPSVGFYRKHNNPLYDYLQYHGRARSNKYMVHKRDVRGMLKTLNKGEVTFYLPDQDYGRANSEFVPFFAVPEVATTKGTLLFAKRAKCETLFVMSMYKDGGYVIKFLPGLENFPSGDDKDDVARVNQRVEEMVLEAPEQYLWMHKRFKTRPNESDPSLYD